MKYLIDYIEDEMDEFEEVAPILYQISKKDDFSGIVATDFLNKLLRAEIMQPQHLSDCLSYKNSIKICDHL